MKNYEKLKIVMTEYEILKREAMERVKSQLQMYPIALGAISLLFGYVLVNQKYEALLLLPFITILLTYRWIWEVKLVDANRKYLLKIESEIIPKLIGSSEGEKAKDTDFGLVGWQNYYEEWRKKQPMDWLISAFMLLGVPTAISIFYCVWFLNSSLRILVIDTSSLPAIIKLPNILYLLAAVTYVLLSFRILWIGRKTLQEREQNQKERRRKEK